MRVRAGLSLCGASLVKLPSFEPFIYMNHERSLKGFFYGERQRVTAHAAEIVLKLVWEFFGPRANVLDIGCGVGTWLRQARLLGASHIRGIEAAEVKQTRRLVIEEKSIEVADLEQPWSVTEKYNLAICLEVAEHLTRKAGLNLVKCLCEASPLILFSAAIPGQGGNGHINEQWPTYWQQQFALHGLRAMDCIRPRIWQDTDIPWWYRQNIVLFGTQQEAKKYYLSECERLPSEAIPVLGVRHPCLNRCNTVLEPRRFGRLRNVVRGAVESLVASSMRGR
jgi:hypothetical protein